MDRNLYFVAIAFFGMINGLFNQSWLVFSLIHMQILAPALLFGSVPLTLMFCFADGLDGDDHPGRHSRRHLRADHWRQGRLDGSVAMDMARRNSAFDAAGDWEFFYLPVMRPRQTIYLADLPPRKDTCF